MSSDTYDTLDERFRRCVRSTERPAQLFEGCRWAEGPAWFAAGRQLVWSDIPNDRMLRWDEPSGTVGVFRAPAANSNGNTVDPQGRLVTCEHGNRRVTRTEHDGSITVIADAFEGRRLNSPNDVVVRSDGSIWFSDPPFGILGYYEGHKAAPELPTNVYRIDPSAAIGVATGDVERPNGLAFSPDESKLYVIEASATQRSIYAFDVVDGARLANKRKLVDAGRGTPDGMRVDVDGNLWVGWGMGEDGLDGVEVFNSSGLRIGRIDLPERCANLCFGGRHRNRLFMCGSTSLYSLFVNTQGAATS